VEDLVADPEVEVVDIASRSTDHYAHACLALEAGKVAVVEKPFCLNATQAHALQKRAAEAPGTLYVRHNGRFEPGFLHIREIMAAGLLGEVYEIKLRRVRYQRRDDWQTLLEHGGGQLLNWGPHLVDHALQLLESPVARQWSDLKRIAAVGDAEDHVKIVLQGENGRIVDLEISGGAAIGEPEFLVWGTRGALSCTGDVITLRHLDPAVALAERQADPGTPAGGFGTPEDLPWIERTFPAAPAGDLNLSSIWEKLYATLRQGQPFPITLEQAVAVMEVISAARAGTPFEI
jgi:predicted dehydrogenase